MKSTQIIACLVLALAACKSSDAGQSSGAPCETGAPELKKLLDQANGIGVDLSDDKVVKEIEAAKAKLLGKKFAFKNCTMSMQGGEVVTFAPKQGSSDDIGCYMAGGESGTKAFRRAAMDLDGEKLKLDVSGKIAERGEGHFKRLEMTDCKITAHE